MSETSLVNTDNIAQYEQTPVGCYCKTPFTRYSRLSNRLFNRSNRLYNRFDNRVERTATVRSTGCQTGLYNRFDNRLYTRYSRLSNRLSNGFENRLNVCIRDTTGCQTPLTTGCIVYTNNRFDSRLYRVNGAWEEDDVTGAELERLVRRWRKESRSWFQRNGGVYRKERSVIRDEYDVSGRARLRTDHHHHLFCSNNAHVMNTEYAIGTGQQGTTAH